MTAIAPRTFTVGVVGANRWGMTLAETAARGGHQALLWDRDGRRAGTIKRHRSSKKNLPELKRLHDNVEITTDAAELCETCDLIVLACAAEDTRKQVKALGEHVDGHHCIVHAVRGLEAATLTFPSRIVRQETCVRKIGAMLGPILAEDLLAGRPNTGVVASRFPELLALTRKAFAGPRLRIYASDDLVGVETAAAGAAVGAMAIGLCLELGLGAATLAAFTTRGTAELSRVCAAAGGAPTTAFGLAGLGDLIARRESNSREVQAGRMLAKGHNGVAIIAALGQLDAIAAAQTFAELAGKAGIRAHLTRAVAAMLEGKLTAAEAIRGLMNLEQMREG